MYGAYLSASISPLFQSTYALGQVVLRSHCGTTGGGVPWDLKGLKKYQTLPEDATRANKATIRDSKVEGSPDSYESQKKKKKKKTQDQSFV